MFVSVGPVSCLALLLSGGITGRSKTAAELVSLAQDSIQREDADSAFSFLSQAYNLDSGAMGLMRGFEDVFRLRIRLADCEGTSNSNIFQERMGLASLLSDQSRHEEAALELRQLLLDLSMHGIQNEVVSIRSKAASMLFRSHAAVCQWDTITSDRLELMSSLKNYFCSEDRGLPPIHAFEALKWPCISLADTTMIARSYGERAMNTVNEHTLNCMTSSLQLSRTSVPFVKVSRKSQKKAKQIVSSSKETSKKRKKIRLGYLSPDFTGRHPLAFLMQDVFRLHDKEQFETYLYSLSSNDDDSPEVTKIKSSTNNWRVFPASAPSGEIAKTISDHNLDIVIDLCGYTGTFVVAEIMACRVAPVQISYMGFPGSSGAPYIDYLICDQVVVPPRVPTIRQHYSELLITMPHCYFVNSHKYIKDVDYSDSSISRVDYGLPIDGFVLACHSRPDKIDPSTFRSWLRALSMIKSEGTRRGIARQSNAAIWLLSSGLEMEKNLRRIASGEEFGLDEKALIFADIAPRQEHLRRLALADLFLDTPSYNAHTVGCDTLYAGVPMVSLLRPDGDKIEGANDTLTEHPNREEILSDKFASRVGASLLKAAGIRELVASSMAEYESLIIRCARDDNNWYSNLKYELFKNRKTSPLFDTKRWVGNLEAGLIEVVAQNTGRNDRSNIKFQKCDIYVEDE